MNITKHFKQINQIHQVGYNIALSNPPSYPIKLSNQLGIKCCTVANLVANLGLNSIRQLIARLFDPDDQAVINYKFDAPSGQLIHVRQNLVDNDKNVLHSGN